MIAFKALCSGVYNCFGKGRVPIIWVVVVITIVITISKVKLTHSTNPNRMERIFYTALSVEERAVIFLLLTFITMPDQ
jgi:hypothetical protein